jgi:hypothetical protein
MYIYTHAYIHTYIYNIYIYVHVHVYIYKDLLQCCRSQAGHITILPEAVAAGAHRGSRANESAARL